MAKEDPTPPPSGPWRFLLVALVIATLAGFARRDALEVGLMSDDLMQHGMLEGIYPGEGYVPLDLYAFLRDDPELLRRHLEQGTAPWWSVLEGDPDADRGTVSFAVLRPLSSALLSLDRALVPPEHPGAARKWHLHSMLWFVGAVCAAGLALRRVFGPALATVALVLFACDAGMSVPLAWLANRCALVGACLGFLGLWAHLRWRDPDPGANSAARPRLIALEAGCMTLAVAAGEYGLVAAAYVLAYELVAAPRETPHGWRIELRRRALALLPAALPALAYLTLHRALDYGTFGEVYANVFESPRGWLSFAAERIPKLTTSALWAIPAATGELVTRLGEDLLPGLGPKPDYAAYSRAHLWLCAGGLALAGVAFALVRAGLDPAERRGLRFLILGALLGLVPLASAPAQARLLVITQLGASALVAAILVAGTRRVLARVEDEASRGARLRAWARRLAPLPFLAGLAYAHTIGDLRWGAYNIEHLSHFQQTNVAAFARGDLDRIDPERLASAEVVVLNAPNLTTALHGPFVLDLYDRPLPRSWRALGMVGAPLIAARPAPEILELSTVQGAWFVNHTELNFRRSDQRMRAGQVRERPGLRVEILDDLEGLPQRIRFAFDAPLDDPRYLFLIVTPEGIVRWPVPPVGGRGVVPIPGLPELAPTERGGWELGQGTLAP